MRREETSRNPQSAWNLGVERWFLLGIAFIQ